MSNPPSQPLRPDFASLEVDRFEHVPSGTELSLLRIEGRYRSRLARPLLEAALLVDDGLAIHRHDPLPRSTLLEAGIGDDDWLWRAAFAVSVAALEDPETAFVLQAGPGLSIELADPELWQSPAAQRSRRSRGSVTVGRRAAAAAMLCAIALAPAIGPAEAIAQMHHATAPHGDRVQHPAAPAAPSTCTGIPPQAVVPGAACAPAGSPSTGTTQSTGSTASGTGTNDSGNPPAGGGHDQHHKGGKTTDPEHHSPSPRHHSHKHHHHHHASHHSSRPPTPRLRHRNGTPSSSNPAFVDALPGPAAGVPNFVIQKFRVPIFLLPIYQAAGTQYGIRWEILAAINEIETDYGRNLNVSSAGALGWMQFMPATWRTYGTDANHDGKADPYNPVDAIFSAARYLKAAGGDKNVKRGIFAYNHAGWYVDSVLLRAKLLGGMPSDVVGSLTGLTEGRFPVAAHARYADDITDHKALKHVKAGQNAANVVQGNAKRHQIAIYSNDRAPVIAVNDAEVKSVGHSPDRGRYVSIQDVYGNRFTYSGLGSIEHFYPVPKRDASTSGHATKAVSAHPGATGSHPQVVTKRRVFAHPWRPRAQAAGGVEQMFDEQAANGGFSTYSALFVPDLGLTSRNSTLRPLRKGAHVVAGTLLGRVGRPEPKLAAHVNFAIRPAGRKSPQIDPKPILDGWKLLESTAIYRANGKNVLNDNKVTIGQILMMSKAQLEKRVLHDHRIKIYPGGRADIRASQIDRRVLAVLEFLAESGLNPTVSSLRGNHGYRTTSGNVSEHSSGNAVDISAINGIPITGHQDKGGIAEQTVRRLMTLQGSMRPHQIISLLSLGGNTMRMADHYNHVHVGFRPMFGNSKKGGQAETVLKPGQWADLIGRLRQIQNPVVPTSPSRYALPASNGN